MVEVDPEDPAFLNPTKPIGPIYTQKEAEKLRNEKNWEIKRDGKHWRRVVPSPIPHRIFELRPIHWLLEKGTVVICAGGGGIPTIYNKEGKLEGVEVVIDKDRASSLLAFELDADLLILATDTDGVYLDWGTESEKIIIKTTPDEIRNYEFDEGSMGPKVEAACSFVERSGQRAVIGSLKDIEVMVNGTTGTQFVLK
jgi:carbamate kinase